MTSNRTLSPKTWSHVPQSRELAVIAAFRATSAAEQHDGPTRKPDADSHDFLLVCASNGLLEQSVEQALAAAARGKQVLLRTPATPHASFAPPLFEHHDAIAFWLQSEDGIGTMYTYFGPDAWSFVKAFSSVAAVFHRGRGSTGPWAVPKATEQVRAAGCNPNDPLARAEGPARAAKP
jgi:hypothetical protein